ncbi:hypothetical protein ACIGXM_00575 [Kitasatospora sp. NPDC052896]|uniref:hypothetical protein n=1 Tax=Kitasatospora sp. NPDC052896 TaxID=3364061 RepID=UPI0037CA516B
MSSGQNSDERNPFAPPPADAPDQPWRPRLPQGQASGAGGAQGGPEGDDDQPGRGPAGRPPVPPPHPWSPNWQGGGRPERPQAPQQPRFDPTDPVQRRSRYALLSGMAALFSGLSALLPLALLFGALAMYWGISSLLAAGKDEPATAKAARPNPFAAPSVPPGPTAPAAPNAWPYGQRSRPQVPAALGGLLTGGVAVALVLGSFALQLAYRPYFECVNDALTQQAQQSCSTLAPQWLVSYTDPTN